MFPGKDVTPLLFAGGTDDSENLDYVKIRNNYVQESAQRTGFPSLYPLLFAKAERRRDRKRSNSGRVSLGLSHT